MVGRADVSPFDWTKDEDYPDEAEPKADFVLAADCVYHEELIPHLLRAVQAVVHKKSTGALRVCWLLCYVLGLLRKLKLKLYFPGCSAPVPVLR